MSNKMVNFGKKILEFCGKPVDLKFEKVALRKTRIKMN